MENKLAEVVDKAVITEQNMEEILCSNENDVADDLNSLEDVATRGVRGCTTSGRYVRILDFRHFERHMMFSQSDRKTYKKAISDGVNVSVVLDVGCGNT
jgi:hypothetical protein